MSSTLRPGEQRDEEEGPDDYRLPDREWVKEKRVRRLKKLGYDEAVTAATPAA